MNLYFDTSAIAKLFFAEHGSEQVAELVESKHHTIWISQLTHLELNSVLQRRARESGMTQPDITALEQSINEQLLLWNTSAFSSSTLDQAIELVAAHGNTQYLRTLDALQLAAYQLLIEDSQTPTIDWHFVSADIALNNTVRHLNLNEVFIGLHWK
jgi:predicted nucleic acid-binding protein